MIALILDGNDASVNVATKLGMQQRGYVNFDGKRPMLFDIHRSDGTDERRQKVKSHRQK